MNCDCSCRKLTEDKVYRNRILEEVFKYIAKVDNPKEREKKVKQVFGKYYSDGLVKSGIYLARENIERAERFKKIEEKLFKQAGDKTE